MIQSSRLLTDSQLNLYFLKLLFSRLQKIMEVFTKYSAYVKRNEETCLFLQNKFTVNLISAVVNKFAAEFEIFVYSAFGNHQQFLQRGPWSAYYDMTLDEKSKKHCVHRSDVGLRF